MTTLETRPSASPRRAYETLDEYVAHWENVSPQTPEESHKNALAHMLKQKKENGVYNIPSIQARLGSLMDSLTETDRSVYQDLRVCLRNHASSLDDKEARSVDELVRMIDNGVSKSYMIQNNVSHYLGSEALRNIKVVKAEVARSIKNKETGELTRIADELYDIYNGEQRYGYKLDAKVRAQIKDLADKARYEEQFISYPERKRPTLWSKFKQGIKGLFLMS